MVSGRALYRELAVEALSNARELLRDAKKLKSFGSRGHACSLAILAIEESAKALVYLIASQGMIRIVKKNPNNVTTFRESDLLKHEFKHALIAAELEDWLFYGPFYESMARVSNRRVLRSKAGTEILRAIHTHKRQRVEMVSGGKAAQEAKRLFEMLGRLNELKNQGLYVDHEGGHLLTPNRLDIKVLGHVIELAEAMIWIFSDAVKEGLDPTVRKVLVEEMRKSAKQVKRIEERRKKEVGGPRANRNTDKTMKDKGRKGV